MTRKKHETTENKWACPLVVINSYECLPYNRRILDKYLQWEKQQTLLEGVAEGAESGELEELITPKERETAEKVKFNIEK